MKVTARSQNAQVPSNSTTPVAAGTSVPLPGVLYGRGRSDGLYPAERHAADLVTLERLGVAVESVVFDGGHDWTPEFLTAVGRALTTAPSR